MSEAFHIISDGSCDLPVELTQEKNITVVPFYVSFEEGKYQKEMVEIGVREFYQEWWIIRMYIPSPLCRPYRITWMHFCLMSKQEPPFSVSASRPNSAAPCSLR